MTNDEEGVYLFSAWRECQRESGTGSEIHQIRADVRHGSGRAAFLCACLNDSIPKEREIGMAAGLSLLWFCDELWVFGDEISEGMKSEIQFCRNLNIPVRKIRDCDIQKVIGGNGL